jgi:hypothetical protein
MSLHVVRAGLDTLEVSLTGELKPDLAETLDQLKATAIDSPRPFEAGFSELFVKPKAYGFWRWRLVCPEFAIVANASQGITGVVASVCFSAYGLANRPPWDLWTLAEFAWSSLGSLRVLSVSRADAYVDFQGWTPTLDGLAGIVCPAAYRATHGTEKRIQTFQYGKRDTVLRIYEKSAEIVATGKLWVPEAWRFANGYDPELPVWRIETQLRTNALRSLGIETHAQVLDDPQSLLDHGMRWAQLRVPGADTTKTRWPEDECWTALRTAVFGGEPLRRHERVSSLMDLDRVNASFIGLVATAGAYFGADGYMDALQRLSYSAEAHMLIDGVDFAALVEKKRRRIMSGS